MTKEIRITATLDIEVSEEQEDWSDQELIKLGYDIVKQLNKLSGFDIDVEIIGGDND